MAWGPKKGPGRIVKPCSICGELFRTDRDVVTTCGQACARKKSYAQQAGRYAAVRKGPDSYVCVVCGTTCPRKGTAKNTCASLTCRKQFQAMYDRERRRLARASKKVPDEQLDRQAAAMDWSHYQSEPRHYSTATAAVCAALELYGRVR